MSPRIVDIPLRFARCQLVLGDVPRLIDAGTLQDLQRIVAALAREGLQPRDLRRIILTHADGDHAGWAAADPDPIERRLSRRGQRVCIAHRHKPRHLDERLARLRARRRAYCHVQPG